MKTKKFNTPLRLILLIFTKRGVYSFVQLMTSVLVKLVFHGMHLQFPYT